MDWFHPGEVVVVARVPGATGAQAAAPQMHSAVHNTLRDRAREHFAADPTPTRSFVFNAPGEANSLVFSFHKLAEGLSLRAVKDAVDALHQQLGSTRGNDIEIISAMPHWHMRAHEAFGGGSPGSTQRPVYPDQVPNGWTQRFYQPINTRLDQAQASLEAKPVPVAVLDTRPDLTLARKRAQALKNEQLLDTIDWLQKPRRAERLYRQEFKEVERHHTAVSGMVGQPAAKEYPIPDHGLFVAGLIHGLAPRAPISLDPALDEMGRGDLSLLLLGLQRVLASKKPEDPQIINLSLGFRPHPARLPAAWYGLRRPHDRSYQPHLELSEPQRDGRWVAANRGQIGRTVDLLEVGMRELGAYLSLNNCLIIAAAGNDSLAQVEARQARMEPRLPARLDTVLGVAATTTNPRQASRYSNVGDERELGDHVATFGGNASDGLEPEDGVMGVYSGEFPDNQPNETGWAFWSGTSFATGIMSGIAANFWATRRNLDAASVLADLHDEATAFGPYVPALRTPAIEVRGRWRR
jgi:hypothetical protein